VTRHARARLLIWLRRGVQAAVLGLFLVLHLCMGLFDAAHPDVFLKADRAPERARTIAWFSDSISQGAAIDFLASNGNPGDYVPHWVLLSLGGPALVIITQVALILLSGIAVYRLCVLLGLEETAASAGAFVFLLLPHNLVFPHQLLTESLHTPLIILSLLGTVELILLDRASRAPGFMAGLMIGVGNLIRPVTLLWGPVAALAVLVVQRKAALWLLAASLLPVLAYMTFMLFAAGEFSTGASKRDASHNLHRRAERVIDAIASADPAAAEAARSEYLSADGRLSPLGFAAFSLEYPKASLAHSGRDLFVFASKSGIERVTFDYLGMSSSGRSVIQDPLTGWRFQLETNGVLHTLRFLYENAGAVLIISIAGALLFTLLFVLALVGLIGVVVNRSALTVRQQMAFALVAALPVYMLLFSQVVDAVQSRHRGPAEAALLIFAIIGIRTLINLRRNRSSFP